MDAFDGVWQANASECVDGVAVAGAKFVRIFFVNFLRNLIQIDRKPTGVDGNVQCTMQFSTADIPKNIHFFPHNFESKTGQISLC